MKMAVFAKRMCFAVAAAAFLSGCGTSDPREPVDLVDIQPTVTLERVWSDSLGSSITGLLVPAVTSTGVYAAGGSDVYRIDPANGKKLWSVSCEAAITAGVGSDGHYVAVGTAAGELEVFDETGKRLWRNRLSGEMSVPPLVAAGFVLVRTTDTRVTAFDAASGERRWRYQSQPPALTLRVAQQMTLSPAGLLIGQANGKLLALNGEGKVVFEVPVSQPKGITEVERLADVVGTPLVDANMMCAATYQGNVLCLSSQNGQGLWRVAVDAVTGPVTDGLNVYVVDSKSFIHALDYRTGKTVWVNKDLLWRRVSAGVVVGNNVLFADYDGVVHAVDPLTGKIVGRTHVGGAVNAAPVAFDGGALFQSADGDLVFVKSHTKAP